MNTALQGIVIQTIKFSDSKVIARIFTKEHGLLSFVVMAGKSKSQVTRSALQPFSLVDFEVSIRENQSLQSLKNLRRAHVLNTIPFDPLKTTIILFLNEVVQKTIPDNYSNAALFRFLWDAIVLLDDSVEISNFHLWCLLEIARHYGFYPQTDESKPVYFDFISSHFTSEMPLHKLHFAQKDTENLLKLVDREWPEIQHLNMHSSERSRLLEGIISYIMYHLESKNEIRSLKVLHDVFH